MALGDKTILKVAFVEGSMDDWVAYIGPGDWNDKKILSNGIKLCPSTANMLAEESYFKGVTNGEWWRRKYRL